MSRPATPDGLFSFLYQGGRFRFFRGFLLQAKSSQRLGFLFPGGVFRRHDGFCHAGGGRGFVVGERRSLLEELVLGGCHDRSFAHSSKLGRVVED